MNTMLANIGANLVALAAVCAAAWIAHDGKDGWGWFLLVALISSVTIYARK